MLIKDRTSILDNIIKENTYSLGYSGLDQPVDWEIQQINELGNVTNLDIDGITFEYEFLIHLQTNAEKNDLKSKINNNKFSTPNELNDTINQLVYNTNQLPFYSFEKKNNSDFWTIKYRLNYSSSYYNSKTCEIDPSNCEETFSVHAITPNGSINISHVDHFDIYHLLKTVSKYPKSNELVNTVLNYTVELINYNNAFHILQDFCYFMKKKLTLEESYENVDTITKSNNFCGMDFNGPIPDILAFAYAFEGKTVTINSIARFVPPSDANFLSNLVEERYQESETTTGMVLKSLPLVKFIYLNYCRGSNFNNKQCKDFYRSLFAKVSFNDGKLDEDVQTNIIEMCDTKHTYVPDNLYYYNRIPGDFAADDMDDFEELTKEECEQKCNQNEKCSGFVMVQPVVEFYLDSAYSEIAGVLSEGKYDTYELQKNGIPNDQVVTVRIPENLILICYEDGYFSGDSVALTGDQLLANFNFNNKLSSVQITQFNCDAYKERYPELYRAYPSCQLLQNHFLINGLQEGRDASAFLEGKGCWLKNEMTSHEKNNARQSFLKQDTDDVCSCFYKEEYYQQYLKDNNYPKEAERDNPDCWFPKCFAGLNPIKPEPNAICPSLVICNNEIQNILTAGGDIKNVNINTEQFASCETKGESSDQKKEEAVAPSVPGVPTEQQTGSSETTVMNAKGKNEPNRLLSLKTKYILLGVFVTIFILCLGGIYYMVVSS